MCTYVLIEVCDLLSVLVSVVLHPFNDAADAIYEYGCTAVVERIDYPISGLQGCTKC